MPKPNKPTPRAQPRHQRKQQIRDHLTHRQRASMRQIARALDLVPSSKLMNILWELVDEGLIVATPRSYLRGAISIAWDFQGVCT